MAQSDGLIFSAYMKELDSGVELRMMEAKIILQKEIVGVMHVAIRQNLVNRLPKIRLDGFRTGLLEMILMDKRAVKA